MATPKQQPPLSPGGRDPAEGPREGTDEVKQDGPMEESHLGRAGDPAEGRRDDGDGAQRPAP